MILCWWKGFVLGWSIIFEGVHCKKYCDNHRGRVYCLSLLWFKSRVVFLHNVVTVTVAKAIPTHSLTPSPLTQYQHDVKKQANPKFKVQPGVYGFHPSWTPQCVCKQHWAGLPNPLHAKWHVSSLFRLRHLEFLSNISILRWNFFPCDKAMTQMPSRHAKVPNHIDFVQLRSGKCQSILTVLYISKCMSKVNTIYKCYHYHFHWRKNFNKNNCNAA